MKRQLESLSLYDFANTNISYELMAYATVIDKMNAYVRNLLRENFIDTAVAFGLDDRELVIGAVRNDLSTQKRREMLLLREKIDDSYFTLAKIKSSLDSFGFEYTLHEFPSLYTVVIDAVGGYTSAQKAWIKSQVKKIMPAHLYVDIVLSGLTFADIDARNNTFSYIDSKNITWESIDNLE